MDPRQQRQNILLLGVRKVRYFFHNLNFIISFGYLLKGIPIHSYVVRSQVWRVIRTNWILQIVLVPLLVSWARRQINALVDFLQDMLLVQVRGRLSYYY